MTVVPKDSPWLPPEYYENRDKFPLEELAKYRGLAIAFSWDGSRIVASGRDDDEVWDNVVAAGLNPYRVVYSYVDEC
jgi:hypothetical protein